MTIKRERGLLYLPLKLVPCIDGTLELPTGQRFYVLLHDGSIYVSSRRPSCTPTEIIS